MAISGVSAVSVPEQRPTTVDRVIALMKKERQVEQQALRRSSSSSNRPRPYRVGA
jgi:hypothetical protein